VLAALTAGHKIGLGVAALIFIGFSLVTAMLIPRRRPDFPGKLLPAFVIACATLFVAMMAAVEVFGVEEKKPEEPGKSAPAGKPPTAGDATRGKMLYASLGCQGCHSIDGSKNAGPTFKGLAGSKVELTGGSTVTADERYLTESIMDPDKQIVKGFQKGLMSSTIKPGQVSKDDAAALVAYIESVK
jgi:cytochrome c oxidase subunit 2